MTNKLTIQLRDGRTETQVYEDSAVVQGWTPTITQITSHEITDGSEVPEGATNVQTFTNEDGERVTYDLEETIDNPQTAEEFGKEVVRRKFAEQDAQLESDAVKIKAMEGYNI